MYTFTFGEKLSSSDTGNTVATHPSNTPSNTCPELEQPKHRGQMAPLLTHD